MTMMIRIGNLNIAIRDPLPWLQSYCKDYIAPDDGVTPDFSICVTDEEIERENRLNDEHDRGYLQGICAYRKICQCLPDFDAFLLHAAVVSVDGQGYAFSAKSGTGKSTHIAMWRKTLGRRIRIVNGDKPIIRPEDDTVYAFGTPWSGKEKWNDNVKVPLKAICFLERSSGVNAIQPLDKEEAAIRIMHQVLRPDDPEKLAKTLMLLNRTLEKTETWLLKCDVSAEAAKLSFETMTGLQA